MSLGVCVSYILVCDCEVVQECQAGHSEGPLLQQLEGRIKLPHRHLHAGSTTNTHSGPTTPPNTRHARLTFELTGRIWQPKATSRLVLGSTL